MKKLALLFLLVAGQAAAQSDLQDLRWDPVNQQFVAPFRGSSAKYIGDFERGVCSLVVTGATGFTTNYCTYSRLGKEVHVISRITFSSVSVSSDINFSGLPYAAKTGISQNVEIGFNIISDNLNHTTTGWKLNLTAGATTIDWDTYTFATPGSAANVANTTLGSSGNINLNFTYLVD